MRAEVEAALAEHFGRPVPLDARRRRRRRAGRGARPTPPHASRLDEPSRGDRRRRTSSRTRPPTSARDVDRLADAFPGAELVEEEDDAVTSHEPRQVPDLGGLLDSFQQGAGGARGGLRGRGRAAVRWSCARSGDWSSSRSRIAPDVVDPDDVEMLQDLVLAALHDLARRWPRRSSEAMGALGGARPRRPHARWRARRRARVGRARRD